MRLDTRHTKVHNVEKTKIIDVNMETIIIDDDDETDQNVFLDE